MGYTLIWVLSTSDTYHITNEWAQRTSEWCDMCHELIKSILKYNPCYNLFITYHIQGIVRMYQWVRNAILAYLMITYNLQIGRFGMFFMTQAMLILRYARQAQHIAYVMFAMFSKHYLVVIGSQCERVPGNGLLLIESMWCLLNNLPRVLQWSQRMTLKQDINSWFIFAYNPKLFLGPIAVARRRSVGRSVGRSVRPSTPVTRQPIFGSFSKFVGIFLGWISLDLFFVFVKF